MNIKNAILIIIFFCFLFPGYLSSITETQARYKRDKAIISITKSNRELTRQERASILSWIREWKH